MVRYQVSVSLDGFTTGPNDSVEEGLGEGGERLHEWVVALEGWRAEHGYEGGETGPENDMFEKVYGNRGAVVMGRRMFDHGEKPWGEEPPFGTPVFVVTHREREPLEKVGTTFHFVTDGVESALEQAKEAAGDKNVSIAGGARSAQQLLEAGQIDEIHLHVVPVAMGGGVPLFENLDPEIELERTMVLEGPNATHISYRPIR